MLLLINMNLCLWEDNAMMQKGHGKYKEEWWLSHHTNSLDVIPRFDSAGISSLDYRHDNTNEKEHLALLHTDTHTNSIVKIQNINKNPNFLLVYISRIITRISNLKVINEGLHPAEFLKYWEKHQYCLCICSPAEVETLVCQKTESKLQTREEEKIKEVNESQEPQLLHLCQHTASASSSLTLFSLTRIDSWKTACFNTNMLQKCKLKSNSRSFGGGASVLVTAEKLKRLSGFKRLLESVKIDDVVWKEKKNEPTTHFRNKDP